MGSQGGDKGEDGQGGSGPMDPGEEQAWHVILGDPSLPWGDPMREVLQDREGQW